MDTVLPLEAGVESPTLRHRTRSGVLGLPGSHSATRLEHIAPWCDRWDLFGRPHFLAEGDSLSVPTGHRPRSPR